MIIALILLPIIVAFVFVVYNFLYFLVNKKIYTRRTLFIIIEIWTIVVLPTLFLLIFDISEENDCCTDSAIFSPSHNTGIYCLIIASVIAYIFSISRKSIFPPIQELLINLFLIIGVIINVLLCIHLNEVSLSFSLWGFGNIPIILLLLIRLSENQTLLKEQIETKELTSNSLIGNICLLILQLNPIYKYSILTLLLAPLIILLSLFLLLFGQKPDSIIKAFTDTYKHGFSQLDYMCANVECGGHFLCSVGANGHKSIVKPVRYGERNGGMIICNRQLLISNAFEELLQQKLPKIHKFIRHCYNKVGNSIHKHYHIFNNKFTSDFVYLLMKPLEFLFLIALYTFDKNPENRIASQYLSRIDKIKISTLKDQFK